MPWNLTNRGEGWATRHVAKRGTTIYYQGIPVDYALNGASATRRIKKYREGLIDWPPEAIKRKQENGPDD